jgi:putative restriction endonuclease
MGQEEQERRWRQALSQINTWKRGEQRAVHKPLLTLMLIARAASNGPRHIHFADIADALTRLLKEFGPSRTQYHPEFPFWHLQSDGFWTIENPRNFSLKSRGRSPAKRTLIANNAVEAVPEDLWETLRRSLSLCKELTQQLLDAFWPSTLHTAIRQAIGLPQPTEDNIATIRRATRLPRFREEILRAYQRRCAVCGYDGRLADVPLGLEAAHIKWHAYQGPDQVDNGMALCSFHHIALDAGALGLSDDLHILVSCDVNGQTMIEELLYCFEGRRLLLPQSSYPPPARDYVAWHRKEVFRAPARTAAYTHQPVLPKAAEGKERYTHPASGTSHVEHTGKNA